MDERRVHIDEFFRRQMEGYAEMPPPAVWDALEKRLDEKPGRKRPFPIWWFWTIAGLVVLSSAVIIAGYLNTPTQPVTVHTTTLPQAQQSVPASSIHNTQENSNYNNSTTQNTIAQTGSSTPQNTNNITNNNAYNATTQDNNNTQASANSSQPLHKQTITHATQGNIENPSAETDNHQANPQRLRDRLRLLSAMSFGFEFPVHIPAATVQGEVKLPETTIPGNDGSAIASLPVSATDHSPVQPPVPEMALASNTPFNASLPGITDSDGDATDMPYAAPPQDTSKKKPQQADTDKSILDETVYAVNTTKKKPLPLSAGFKLGFTRGFEPVWNANKWVIAPYVEYGLPSNFSVMFQPAFLIGKAKTGTFSNADQVFYEIRNTTFDSIAYVSRGKIDSSVITPNPPDTVFRTYRYGQVYDSIHVGYKVTNTQQWDAELPIMVKYKVNKTFAFIAGASATYSSVLRTKEEVTRYEGLMKQHEDIHSPQTFYVTTQGQEPPPGPARKDLNTLFPYNTAPFSNYQPRQITETNNFWRYGFMVGASATIKDRLMVELLLHKSGVDVNAVPDKQLQRIYTQPYLRLMVGYKLTK